uniref:Uncharacterized protein n=1 Tax=Oryza brachyantha TaxID=4533 RepID=J3LB92_ORYBR
MNAVVLEESARAAPWPHSREVEVLEDDVGGDIAVTDMWYARGLFLTPPPPLPTGPWTVAPTCQGPASLRRRLVLFVQNAALQVLGVQHFDLPLPDNVYMKPARACNTEYSICSFVEYTLD